MENWVVVAALAVGVIGIGIVLYRRKQRLEAEAEWQRRQEQERVRTEAHEQRLREEAEAKARNAVVILPVEVPPPPEGNVFEILEEQEPDLDDERLHLFPDRPKPVTRFEEFNWYLFIAHVRADATGTLKETIVNDFPSVLHMKDGAQLVRMVHERLRPMYPVIHDSLGWWSSTSSRLEMFPDDPDTVADVYLGLPPERRPVVISPLKATGGTLTFYRFGFEPFSITPAQMQPFGADALRYILEAFTGDRMAWKWFSIARMRQQLSRRHRELEEQNQVKQTLEAEKARRAHENRFVALFDLVDRPADAPEEGPGENADADTPGMEAAK